MCIHKLLNLAPTHTRNSSKKRLPIVRKKSRKLINKNLYNVAKIKCTLIASPEICLLVDFQTSSLHRLADNR